MKTKLERISQLSKEIKTWYSHLFSISLIDKHMLKRCYESMDKNKAVGIDVVTKEDYEAKLNEKLDNPLEWLKKHSYKPKPFRRIEIRKPNGKMSLLGIYSYENKLV